jgi:hypothetical protein
MILPHLAWGVAWFRGFRIRPELTLPTVTILQRIASQGECMSDVYVQVESNPARDPPSAAKVDKSMPKWESDARERVKGAVKKFQKPLADLVARDANEGDTRLLVTDILCDGLGYDKYEDLTTEYQVKVDFADYGVRVDKQLVAFIEVKRCTQALNQKHLHQVQSYAVNEGVEWMLLTNGRVWQAWHMSPGMPVQMDKVIDIDLLSDEPVGKKADAMFYLSRDSFKKHQIDEMWKRAAATSPKSLAKVILSEKVLDEIAKELRRQTGHRAEPKALEEALRTQVIDASAL